MHIEIIACDRPQKKASDVAIAQVVQLVASEGIVPIMRVRAIDDQLLRLEYGDVPFVVLRTGELITVRAHVAVRDLTAKVVLHEDFR